MACFLVCTLYCGSSLCGNARWPLHLYVLLQTPGVRLFFFVSANSANAPLESRSLRHTALQTGLLRPPACRAPGAHQTEPRHAKTVHNTHTLHTRVRDTR